MVRKGVIAALAVALVAPAAAQDAKVPYWASISSGKAMTRTGPGRTYPGLWMYQRRDLPVRVLKVYDNWRLIEDPDGAKGWMLVSLMSGQRTFMIKPGEPRPMHEKASADSRVAYRLEAGVVGRIEKCADGWCRVTIGKKRGWVAQENLFGTAKNEPIDD